MAASLAERLTSSYSRKNQKDCQNSRSTMMHVPESMAEVETP